MFSLGLSFFTGKWLPKGTELLLNFPKFFFKSDCLWETG